MEIMYHNYVWILYFQLTFARFFMPVFLPDAEKAIYLDDDVIVQGKVYNFIVYKHFSSPQYFFFLNVFLNM